MPGFVWRARLLKRAVEDARTAAGLRSLWLPFRSGSHATLGVGAGSPELLLYRRVLEVLEGLDRLAAAHDPHGRLQHAAREVARAHQVDDGDVVALARAALIRYARDWDAAGQPAGRPPAAGTAPSPAATTARDWRTDARRLVRTARFLRQSPLVGEIVDQVRTAGTTTRRTITLPEDTNDGQASDCTCLLPESYEAQMLEYSVGREERDKAIRELQAECVMHGRADLPA